MLWRVEVFGGTYDCSIISLSEELSEMYEQGTVGDRRLVYSDFVIEDQQQTFADLEVAHAWFATDWDMFAQGCADRLFAKIDPARYGDLS